METCSRAGAEEGEANERHPLFPCDSEERLAGKVHLSCDVVEARELLQRPETHDGEGDCDVEARDEAESNDEVEEAPLSDRRVEGENAFYPCVLSRLHLRDARNPIGGHLCFSYRQKLQVAGTCRTLDGKY